LHFISLDLPSSRHRVSLLALERADKTLDLSDEVLQQIGCSDASWSIESWNYSPAQAWMRAQTVWSCDKGHWSGELQIIFDANGVRQLTIVRRARLAPSLR
jgi:hypothetical protein